jgi:glutathione S-transferase
MLQLYGIPRSRAFRCLWMLEEVGQPYELVRRSAHPDDMRTPDYLRLNPNARIPTLIDGDLVLWESLAINLYLAQKYDGPMHAGAPEMHAQATQWSLWAVLEVEPLALDLLHHRAALDEFARDASLAERNELLLRWPLGILDGVLTGRRHLLGENFSVADLNVAAILSWAQRAGFDFTDLPEVDRWLDACLTRQAFRRVREMMTSSP